MGFSATGPATEVTLDALLTALKAIRDTAGVKKIVDPVALDSATLAALETINVGNFPADPATQTTLNDVLTALTALKDTAGIKKITDPVALDAATLTALETISVANFPADPPTQTKLEAVRTELETFRLGTTSIGGAAGQTATITAGTTGTIGPFTVTGARTVLFVFSAGTSYTNMGGLTVEIGGASGGTLLGPVLGINEHIKNAILANTPGVYYDDRGGMRQVQFKFTALAAGALNITYDWEARA